MISLFLGEAVVLAILGGLAGLSGGGVIAWLIGFAVPGLPVQIAWDYVLLAMAVAAGIGILAGVAPAMRAAGLDPVTALHDE